MSAKLKYTLVMLGAVLAALSVELWFAFDSNESTPPITDFNERYKREQSEET